MKIWTTDLETWRYWHEYDGTPESLLAKLRREEPVPDYVEYGSLWHQVLERYALEAAKNGISQASLRLQNGDSIATTYKSESTDGTVRNRLRFIVDDDADIPLTPVPEHRFVLPVGKHVVTGKADGIYPDGIAVVEYKTSPRAPKMENYADSWQWRTYLLGTNTNACRYCSVQLFAPRRQDNREELELRIRNPAEATYWRYDDMQADVEDAVMRFVADAEAIGWEGR